MLDPARLPFLSSRPLELSTTRGRERRFKVKISMWAHQLSEVVDGIGEKSSEGEIVSSCDELLV